ncbi:hypothetical protein ACFYNW_00625 [Streptomyces virginiae]|uniref:hypothetical protein n=1 Tax=Streptomyces virginiae TaxID=1961 RepID=UPI0036E7897E
MVTCHDLYASRVDQWQKAADDWVDLTRRSPSACEDIRAQGEKPRDDHWADATGKPPVSAWKTSPTALSPAGTS